MRPVSAEPAAGAGGWVALAAGAALVITAAALGRDGPGLKGTDLALRLTARLGFGFFLAGYLGGALKDLGGERFAPLKRRARAMGLAFAAVLAVHLSLVAWRCWIGDAPGRGTFAVFAPAALCVAALAVSSIGPVGRAIGPAGWWILRNVGLSYVTLAFIRDFVRPSSFTTIAGLLAYAPFAALALAAIPLRVLAWLKRRWATGQGARPKAEQAPGAP
jgi:hypothetical protein